MIWLVLPKVPPLPRHWTLYPSALAALSQSAVMLLPRTDSRRPVTCEGGESTAAI